MKSILAAAFVAIALAGCAAPRMYEWGAYDQGIYTLYKTPESAEVLKVALEVNIAALEDKGKKPAPGLYAELGTLYLQSGDQSKALFYYGKEQAAWPESRSLMDAMSKQLQRNAERKQ